ncbi:uncharacterized protein (TIGR00251 family) [Actimicrobium sp. GrIS 1.19]|uniref:DUF167 domain-containing protein n=1 Tax=Actimicrobium sp. GrIS 1.19 TaxID=3071708 RepID=UPI002DF8003B|nr:uncharacterized protein (TIGR00251 family) [Actimicrobium sp. GrIS 1.19]
MATSPQPWCSVHGDVIRLAVQVTPNARKSEIVGVADDVLKIRLQAQPIEGKANAALIRFLSERLQVARTSVTVTHGLTSKRKLLQISGTALNIERVGQLLLAELS